MTVNRDAAKNGIPKGIRGNESSYQSLGHCNILGSGPGWHIPRTTRRGQHSLGTLSGVLALRSEAVSSLAQHPEAQKADGIRRWYYVSEKATSWSRGGGSKTTTLACKSSSVRIGQALVAHLGLQDHRAVVQGLGLEK